MTPLLLSLLMLQDPIGLDKVDLAATPVKVLEDRLTLRMPEGTKDEARRGSIMAAAEPNCRETRLVWTSGEQKIVVMVYELFQTADRDFVGQLKKVVGLWDMDVDLSAIREDGTLRICIATPRKIDASADAVYILGVFTAQADGSVQSIRMYANPAAARDAAACAVLVGKIADSIKAGSRKLTKEAGTRMLEKLDGGKRVVVDVPEGFTLTTQTGPDFQVVSILKIVPLGERAQSFNVYFGGFPGYQFKNQTERPEVRAVQGTLLGERVAWHHWSSGGKSPMHVKEALGDVPGGGGEKIHVFLVAPTTDDLGSVDSILDKLRIEEKK
jgi:hypothetical protein